MKVLTFSKIPEYGGVVKLQQTLVLQELHVSCFSFFAISIAAISND